MFSIKRITILEKCRHRKNLEAGDYTFGECPIRDFYGENVSLHVIVGKNGSGKSSLLDMILRMANNLGAVVLKEVPREAAADLNYVLGVYADLRYTIDMAHGEVEACLSCRDRAIWIECDGKAYWFSSPMMLEHDLNRDRWYRDLEQRLGYEQITHAYRPNNIGVQQEIAQRFFYTVATNYSMLGFLSTDYEDEDALCYTFIDGEWTWRKTKNWLFGLFHKNDGYMCPVVLNPYRDNTVINMGNETNLTVQRLAALWICEDENAPLLEDYRLDSIQFELKPHFMEEFKMAKGGMTQDQLLAEFVSCATNGQYVAYHILRRLGCNVMAGQPRVLTLTAMYIVQKVLNIAGTYPSYIKRFGAVGDINKTFMMLEDGNEQIVVGGLASEVYKNHSHIELKVLQSMQFYHWGADHTAELRQLGDTFSYSDFRTSRKLPRFTNGQLPKCMGTLPPPIFKESIFVRRKHKDGHWEKGIPLAKMSSGERQMVYQMSTILYHIHNLRSVSQGNLRYHNINILLDEIEICYHPEFQKEFIKRLTSMIKNQRFNQDMRIHILMTTHSPFVLSDVTASQIIYLENGHQLKDKELQDFKNPFVANVNDIIKQSFFMKRGFVGDLAADIINKLVCHLTGEKIDAQLFTDDYIESIISNVGDPVVAFQLKQLQAQHKSRNNADYRQWLESELRKLDRL